ncbi:HAD domain-containing protein [Comamonas sp. MYb69]
MLFLDFDDVICLNNPYGGYDVLYAFRDAERKGLPIDRSDDLWTELFDSSAKENLTQFNEEFHPLYVLSTSWRWFFDRAKFVETLEASGLAFVARNLHEDWSTPQISRNAQRAVDIRRWLSNHPECANSWVALDDELSGTGFSTWQWHLENFVVLCQEGVGLQELELMRLREALTLRKI